MKRASPRPLGASPTITFQEAKVAYYKYLIALEDWRIAQTKPDHSLLAIHQNNRQVYVEALAQAERPTAKPTQ